LDLSGGLSRVAGRGTADVGWVWEFAIIFGRGEFEVDRALRTVFLVLPIEEIEVVEPHRWPGIGGCEALPIDRGGRLPRRRPRRDLVDDRISRVHVPHHTPPIRTRPLLIRNNASRRLRASCVDRRPRLIDNRHVLAVRTLFVL
jgi:hypothetical protein